MALGAEYFNQQFFHLPEVEMRANIEREELNRLINSTQSARSNKLEQQIKKLEEKEQRMFEALGIECKATPEGIKKARNVLQNNIIGYNDARNEGIVDKVSNLYGSGLRETFINPLDAYFVNKNKIFDFFYEYLIVPEIVEAFSNSDSSGDAIATKASDYLADYLNSLEKSSGSKTRYRSKSFTSEKKDAVKRRIVEKLKNSQSKEVQELKNWLKQNNIEIDFNTINYDELEQSIMSSDIKESTNGFSLNITFSNSDSIFDITDKKASKEVNNQDKHEANKKIEQMILEACPNADTILLQACIGHVLSRKSTAFFTGESVTQIIGIIGEIEALYVFSHLLGNSTQDRINALNHRLDWVGGMMSSNSKQPHVDVVLDDEFGIQVKNSLSDFTNGYTGNISFTELNLSSFLDKINFTDYERGLIEGVYQAYTFNVPYKKVKNFVRMKSKKAFNSTSDMLKLNVALANKLLDSCAAILMYMVETEYAKEVTKDNTSLYIIGGFFVQTASQVLEEIKESLDQEKRRFRIKATLNKKGQDIVDVLNSIGDIPTIGGQMNSANILITSSFQFNPGRYIKK